MEEIASRDPPDSPHGWNSLPPTLLAGRALCERALSLADPGKYSISRFTGPDDGFFHINERSHKYSIPKGGGGIGEGSGGGGGVAAVVRLGGVERRGRAMQVEVQTEEGTVWGGVGIGKGC